MRSFAFECLYSAAKICDRVGLYSAVDRLLVMAAAVGGFSEEWARYKAEQHKR